MKKLALILPLIGILISACKKDTIEPDCPGSNMIAHTFHTEPGTFWIYEYFNVDSLGNATSTNDYDTVRIVGDTIVGIFRFVKYEKYDGLYNSTYNYYNYDSLGFVINLTVNPQNGSNINYHFFPSDHVIKEYNSGSMWSSYYVKMSGDIESKTVPFGTYDCVVEELHYFDPNGGDMTNCHPEAIMRSYYDPQIGMVSSQTGYVTQITNCGYQEKRLIEFYEP